MRIIQLPPVISSRGNTPPSSKPNGTTSSPDSNGIDSTSAPNKHFLIINTSRRFTENNNSRKTNNRAQPSSVPTCERLDKRGIRTFVGNSQQVHPGSTEFPTSGENGVTVTSPGGRFKDEADKENTTPRPPEGEGEGEKDGSDVTMSPGHVRNMIALFSSPGGASGDLAGARSRSMSPEWQKGASPIANGNAFNFFIFASKIACDIVPCLGSGICRTRFIRMVTCILWSDTFYSTRWNLLQVGVGGW